MTITTSSNSETKKYTSLSHSLVMWFLLLSLLPLSIVSWLSYQQASKDLVHSAASDLEHTATLSARFIHNWFKYRMMDLRSQAEAKNNRQLLATLVHGFKKSGKPLAEYVRSYDWVRRTSKLHNDLTKMSRRYDYIHDLFLIDQEGNLLFSVAHEADLGTNFFTGSYADTRFARSVKTTLQTGRSLFSDLERYAPSNNIIAGFLTAPVLDELGNKMGVFAIQIRIEKAVGALQKSLKKQTTLTHYILGKDGQLRSPIYANKEEVLRRVIDTEQFRRWQQEFDKYEPDELKKTVFDYAGPSGKQVIGIHQTLNVAGNNWVLISEIDKSEAVAPANWLGLVTLALVLLTAVTVVFVAIYLARRITQPIIQLANSSMRVAAGETDQYVEVNANNEIGKLATAFNNMLHVRNRHEQELEQTTQQAQMAFTELSEQKFALDQHAIVTTTDVTGTITFVNDKFAEISGYSREELLGQNHRIVKSGYHDKEFFRDMFKTLSKGEVWHGEICNKAKKGSLYWVDATIVPFMGRNNKPQSYIAIRTDITERKQYESELVQARDAAEDAVHAKSEFLASMSHEIRTPMNGVLGMLGLVLNTSLDKEQHHRITIAQSSAQSLLTLINDILDFSKVDAGKLELEFIDFDLHGMLSEFAETMAYQIQTNNLELVLDLAGIKQKMVKGDPDRLRQILTNIVGNAIKFTKEGEIVIRANLQEQDDQQWKFNCTVVDTGIGIPEDKQTALFDSFTQVDASTTRQYGGTGLGLAICKKLCELMGGEISVSSELGNGSCFSISILLQKSQQAQQLLPEVDLSELRLLIVDDNFTNREVLREQLEYWGATVVKAESGQQALSICEQRAAQVDQPFFDIALLDMQMPGMDGEQLGKALQSDPRFMQMKLVMMTSMGYQGEARRFAEIGFSAYFPKPVTTLDLFSALSVVAEDGEARQHAEPLVTQHYVKTLSRQKKSVIENASSAMSKKTWPENTRVLLVEDNQVNQLVAEGILNKIGISSDIAGNGLEALNSLKAASDIPYTLVLMDCQMPEMDGYEATQAIRRGDVGERYKTIPVIAMTANAMDGDREKCLQAGMDDYLSKPVDPEKIVDKLQQWLAVTQVGKTKKSEPAQNQVAGKNVIDDALAVWDKDDALKRLMGKETLLNKIIDVFFNETPERMAQLQSAIDKHDCEQAHHLAHTLKGVVANLSGLRVQKQATLMETAAKQAATDDLKKLMPGLVQTIEELTECFKAR